MTELFVVALGIVFAALLGWGFRTLPGERWQILAAVPLVKGEDGRWRGLNFTYYGLFSAIAYVVGAALLVVLTGAVSVPISMTMAVIVLALIVCVPASRVVAILVEGKHHTFTVAGASFVGVVIAPFIIWLVNDLLGAPLHAHIALVPMLAAMSIAYTIGEGLGRLACISFGCCYGRKVDELGPKFRKLVKSWNFEFLGDTKKIAYASGMAGVKVVPVQAYTAVLYTGTGLLSIWLYLRGHFFAALVLSMAVTQIWRLVSEFMRADYRGDNRISAYQIMAVVSVIYAIGVAVWFGGAAAAAVNLGKGLMALWSPGPVIALQAMALIIFWYTGRSEVTESNMSIHVCYDRV
jgi:hypothetical protein